MKIYSNVEADKIKKRSKKSLIKDIKNADKRGYVQDINNADKNNTTNLGKKTVSKVRRLT